jgi:hypothetical protein
MSSVGVGNIIYRDILGRVIYKCYQYAIDDSKKFIGLIFISIMKT